MNFCSNRTKWIATFVTGLVHYGRKFGLFYAQSYSAVYTRAGVLVHHTVYTAVVGTVRLLLGSSRNGQAMLYLFQKLLPCWKYVVYRSVMLRHYTYLLSLTLLFVRIFWHSISLHPLKEPEGSCELQSNVFEMDIRDSSSCVRCASSLTSLPVHHPW
jgi:hypothetical protein